MGKETKELLKALLKNTELIMKHLNIAAPGKGKDKKEMKQAPEKSAAKPAGASKKSSI